MKERLIIGAMSGTSADGVDVVLTRIIGTALTMRATPVASASVPFDERLRSAIFSCRRTGQTTLRDLAAIGRDVAIVHAAAIEMVLDRSHFASADVTAIAAHGQTLFHDPPLTIQQFDPAMLAAMTGIDVISDFRRADLAIGGQGAPLVPFADYLLFRSKAESRVVLNLGGIANVTMLPAGGGIDTVTGFDTGPANCISDALMHGAIDLEGSLAGQGTPALDVVAKFCEAEFILRHGAKSTDGPAMLALFEAAMGGRSASLKDQLATAAMIVAECVLRQTPNNSVILLAGGGANNLAIVNRLRAARTVRLTDDFGIAAQDREGVAFAILGAAFLDRVPANLPAVTGGSRRVVLGALWPATGR